MAKENLIGRINLNMMVILKIIVCKDMENITGLMVELIKEIGKLIK